MSAQRRRPQQPQYQQQQPQQQQYYPQQPPQQHYAQDPNYAQFGGAPYQQQQVYYHPQQQYPSADPYASASTSPYPQHVQYQNTFYHAPPPGVGYQNATPAAYPQGAYLGAADYAAPAGDASPNHLTPGSMSSGHSPRPSAGRSRLTNFVFPSQGASPSLESQVAQLSIVAPAASLPNKPVPASRPASGLARGPSNTQMTSGTDGSRSDISLRYPPLPKVPERCATPLVLRPERSASNETEAAETSKSEAAPLDPAVLEYVSSLRSIVEAYEKRDDMLRLRTEAVGFQPKQAWSAWQSHPEGPSKGATTVEEPASNPILGVRLLQRLDKLQRENDELGQLLSTGASLTTKSDTSEAEQLRKEIADSHRLIQAMDKALSSAEARAAASERALEAACRSNSTAIVPAKAAADGISTTATGAETEEKKPPKNAAGKKGAKPSSKPNASGGGKNSAAQQQRSTNSNTSKPNKPAAGAGAKSMHSDKPPTSDAKPAKNGHPAPAKSK